MVAEFGSLAPMDANKAETREELDAALAAPKTDILDLRTLPPEAQAIVARWFPGQEQLTLPNRTKLTTADIAERARVLREDPLLFRESDQVVAVSPEVKNVKPDIKFGFEDIKGGVLQETALARLAQVQATYAARNLARPDLSDDERARIYEVVAHQYQQ